MGNSKVIFGNETLIDLTGDTVTSDTLLAGTTAHNRSGEQIVGAVTVPSALDDLTDVDITSPTTDQVLKFDGSKWVNGNGGGGGADALDDLTDVDITTPADGNLLQYNGTSQKWENSNAVPQEIAAMQEAGAVNHLKITATDQVINGVTYGFDGEIISADGTASGSTNINYARNQVFPTGEYVCIFDAVSGTGIIQFGMQNQTTGVWQTGVTVHANYIGRRSFTFTSNGTDKFISQCNVYTGNTVSNRVIKCMICDARLVNPPYQPFTMTNRELTDATAADAAKMIKMIVPDGGNDFLSNSGITTANAFVQGAKWCANSSIAGCPEANGQFMSFKFSSTTAFQMFFSYTNKSKIYFRFIANNTATPWQLLTGTPQS